MAKVLTGPTLAPAPAFDSVTPALLGALAAPLFLKDIKLSMLPVILGIVTYLIMGNAYMALNTGLWMLLLSC